MIQKHERKTIDGKPYFGVWAGKWIEFTPLFDTMKSLEQLNYAKTILTCWAESLDGERRYEEYIYRPYDGGYDPMRQIETLGIKFLLWGRAYRVMRQLKKKAPRVRTKKRVNGRWKWRLKNTI